MAFDWKKISLFENLSYEEFSSIIGNFDTIDVAADTEIISENTNGESVLILISGKVKVSKSMLINELATNFSSFISTPRKVLATLDDTTYPMFGEIALIDHDIRSASVKTLISSSFLSCTQEQFFSLIQQYPLTGIKLLLNISKRLATTVRKNNIEIVKLTTALALSLNR